jgi:hypothetical protein
LVVNLDRFPQTIEEHRLRHNKTRVGHGNWILGVAPENGAVADADAACKEIVLLEDVGQEMLGLVAKHQNGCGRTGGRAGDDAEAGAA